MLSYSEIKTRYQEKTKDTTTANQSLIAERANQIVNLICATTDFTFLQETYTTVTVASQQAYDLPANCRKIESVMVTVDSQKYPLQPIESTEIWDQYNVDTADTTDYPQYYYKEEGSIYLWGIPATAGNTITIRYLKRPVAMSNTDYATGSITATNASTTIEGAGTTFTGTTVNENTKIKIKGVLYDVASITDADTLVLTKKYQGTTAATLTYTLGDYPIIPEEFQDLLWVRPAKEYYAFNKEQQSMYLMLKDMDAELEGKLILSQRTKGVSNVIKRKRQKIRSVNDYPSDLT